MELYDTMRTTFAARDYTGDAVSDAVLYKILENARFAPSGGCLLYTSDAADE